jgi:Transposase IS200 like
VPRPLRVEIPGGIYHVVARGNERKAVFRDDEDREAYLGRLAGCSERFCFRLIAYCLMDNHVHVALERGGIAPPDHARGTRGKRGGVNRVILYSLCGLWLLSTILGRRVWRLGGLGVSGVNRVNLYFSVRFRAARDNPR